MVIYMLDDYYICEVKSLQTVHMYFILSDLAIDHTLNTTLATDNGTGTLER